MEVYIPKLIALAFAGIFFSPSEMSLQNEKRNTKNN